MPDNALHSSAFASADSDAVVSGFLDLSIYFCILTHSVFLGLDTCGLNKVWKSFIANAAKQLTKYQEVTQTNKQDTKQPWHSF